MAAGIYSANGDMQVMNSANNAHHHPQYSLQQQHLAAQQQRGAPQSSVPYPTSSSAAVPPHMSSSANGPAHYQQQQPHHGQMQQQHPPTTSSTQLSGYNNTVVNETDRSRPRGVTGGGEDDEQLQQHRRRRSQSNNRRTAATSATTTDRRTANGDTPQADQPPPGGQYHYPAGVGVSNNVTPPSQDTTAGPGGSGNLTNQTNSSTSALDAAQRRPSYLLHRDLVIGKGSYGQVCIASRGEAEGHHSSSRSGKRKKFACKCVMLRNDPKYIAKLQEEVNVLRELRGHDNVIRLFDVFCVDNELFIITELGRGGDLFHLLTTHPKHGVTEAYAGEFTLHCIVAQSVYMSALASLSLFIADLPSHSLSSLHPNFSLSPCNFQPTIHCVDHHRIIACIPHHCTLCNTSIYTAKTVAEMLSAVSFLHSRHICHRDLKLENWVLESGKDVWSPLKLIDFGLSTHYTPGHRLSRVVGSSYYVAPEVLKKSYTEACDLWSLGVIVYMLLSGAPPFYGRNDEAIKASIVHGTYQFPHELFRDVSDDAMAFVSCLLSYSIEYRYTAEQALTHPWLRSNCDPEMLQRAKDGARGVVAVSDGYDINAMQM
jgi:calcium/calmodulin-dependent protein kinase I